MRYSSIHTIQLFTFPNGLEAVNQVNVGSMDNFILASEVAIFSLALYIGNWLPGDLYP